MPERPNKNSDAYDLNFVYLIVFSFEHDKGRDHLEAQSFDEGEHLYGGKLRYINSHGDRGGLLLHGFCQSQ